MTGSYDITDIRLKTYKLYLYIIIYLRCVGTYIRIFFITYVGTYIRPLDLLSGKKRYNG